MLLEEIPLEAWSRENRILIILMDVDTQWSDFYHQLGLLYVL